MIELLVVILVIGILAAIAIPSFLGNKSKANDVAAKELARSAQTTIETYGSDHGGSFAGVSSPTDLSAIEATLNTSSSNNQAYLSYAKGSSNGYTVVATAAQTGDTYTITDAAGVTSRSCSAASSPSGCSGGSW